MPVALSIIIPHFKDEEALRHLLDQCITPLLSSHKIEVIVVDAGDSGRCRELCAAHSAVYVALEPNRGKQLLAGAQAATGDTLWFLHADATFPPGTIDQILEARKQGIEAGYFRFAFLGPDRWFKAALSYSVNLRNKLGGTPYGDQGIFVERNLYFSVGGHAPTALFEEVPLVRKLRKTNGFAELPFTLPVNPRRWERDGYLKRTIVNRLCALAFMLGISSERISQWYSNRNSNKSK